MSESTAVKIEESSACNAGLFGTGDLGRDNLLRRDLRFFIPSVACTATSGALYLLVHQAPFTIVAQVIALLGLALGYPMFLTAGRALLFSKNKLTTEVFISVALAAVVAIQWFWYASWVISVVWMGETIMAWAASHSRSAIQQLMKLLPREARVVSGTMTRTIPIEEVSVGDVVAVQPGERLPVDGVIANGTTSIDQSALTGESVPVDRGVGDDVFAGTFNWLATIQVKVTRPAHDNTVAQIVGLMRTAQRAQVPIQRTADIFVAFFLPVVIAAAAVTGVVTHSLEQVATILLIATPCAFSAATPLALVATVGNAARRGIIVKTGGSIAAMSRARVALIDKTGTLTDAIPQVAVLEPLRGTEDDLLQLAAIAEHDSSHPLARAVVTAAEGRGLEVPSPDTFSVTVGHGVRASWDGHSIEVARAGAFATDRVSDHLRQRTEELAGQGYTVTVVAMDEEVIGLLAFMALPRRSAEHVIAGLKRLGVKTIIMLTGDSSSTARTVAQQLSIEYQAEATPEAKLQLVQRFKEQGQVVMMVGDGINDATALAAADVGIAMGSGGTEIASSAADVVIHADRLSKVLEVARLSRRGINTIKVSIFANIATNVGGLSLAVAGVLTPATAIVMHVSIFVFVVVNSALVLNANPRVRGEDDTPMLRADPAASEQAA